MWLTRVWTGIIGTRSQIQRHPHPHPSKHSVPNLFTYTHPFLVTLDRRADVTNNPRNGYRRSTSDSHQRCTCLRAVRYNTIRRLITPTNLRLYHTLPTTPFPTPRKGPEGVKWCKKAHNTTVRPDVRRQTCWDHAMQCKQPSIEPLIHPNALHQIYSHTLILSWSLWIVVLIW